MGDWGIRQQSWRVIKATDRRGFIFVAFKCSCFLKTLGLSQTYSSTHSQIYKYLLAVKMSRLSVVSPKPLTTFSLINMVLSPSALHIISLLTFNFILYVLQSKSKSFFYYFLPVSIDFHLSSAPLQPNCFELEMSFKLHIKADSDTKLCTLFISQYIPASLKPYNFRKKFKLKFPGFK